MSEFSQEQAMEGARHNTKMILEGRDDNRLQEVVDRSDGVTGWTTVSEGSLDSAGLSHKEIKALAKEILQKRKSK